MALAPAGVKPIGQDGPLKRWQIFAVALCVFVNICDGLDTTAIAYAAPLILKEWQVPPQTFGLVLSAGAAGLMVGAIIVAPWGDRIGRRNIILAGAAICSLSMLGMAAAQNLGQLLPLRFITGIAVGALVPSLSIMVVEFSNERRGNFFLALVHVGFALGAIVGAASGALLVNEYGWRAIFVVGGVLTSVAAILCFFTLPESIHFLVTRQPKNALERANKLLARFKEPLLERLPEKPIQQRKSFGAVLAILEPLFLRTTLLLWLAAFCRYFVSFFLTSWKPQVLVLAGFTDQSAIAVGMATSGAAAIGVLFMGAYASVIGSARAAALALVACAVALVAFAFTTNPVLLVALSALSMFTIEAAFTGLVITTARYYPIELRSTGLGYAMGVGRFGAVVGPYVGGALIGSGLDRAYYFPVYAAAAIIGAIAVLAAMARTPTSTQSAPREAEAKAH